MASALVADAQTAAPELNPAERWIVEQVKAGKIADLSENKFPNEEDRKLRATFLEDLLTGTLPGVKPHRNGVRIRGAIIDEEIDLTNAQILFEVWLDKCEFNRSATLRRANFAGIVSFDASLFKSGAYFVSMKVGDSAFFRTTIFEAPVDFGSTEIAGNFEAARAQFRNKNLKANFNSIKVGDSAFFTKAVFEGPVDFGWGHIIGTFSARERNFRTRNRTPISMA